ncbi:MAG: HU family DNA-binding protein [Bacteroidales bacterium]|jgi:DNA-binding protein HU-beta|nr:HU family DNA-binding protein [Bacteroidales bacterium]
MTKKEFVDLMASKAGQTKVDATKSYEAFLATVSDLLAKGQNVPLIGFGTFSVVKRAARTGRNPHSGTTMKIPAKNVVKFKVGATLKERVGKKK